MIIWIILATNIYIADFDIASYECVIPPTCLQSADYHIAIDKNSIWLQIDNAIVQ